ncbi:MAG TPA: DUF2098 domain-containing protein [Methanocorpusculum sp.]|nr:DUF2098 domain-containing protein [Methanocorpusculum sp.]
MSEFKMGATVRYSRTGTVGKIVSFAEVNGAEFAGLDSTGLLYRIDQLIAISEEVHATKIERGVKEKTAEERKNLQEIREFAWMNVDNSCEGGG